MCNLTEYPNGTFLLKVPFENIDTAVWLMKNEDHLLLIDCATTATDVEKYILPAVKSLKTKENNSMTLLLSHSHSDHAGGASALLRSHPTLEIYAAMPSRFPSLPVKPLHEGAIFDGFLEVLHLGGHSADACAFFDRRNKTLFTADTVQSAGVSRYGTGVSDSPSRYVDAHLALWRTGATRLIASHEYFPLGRDAHGRAAVREYLVGSLLVFHALLEDVLTCGEKSEEQIASLLTEKRRKEREAHPPVPAFTVRNILKEGAQTLLRKCNEALETIS